MKNIVSILLAFVVLAVSTVTATAQEPSSPVLQLKRSTPVVVELTSIASSNKTTEGSAIVAHDVTDKTTDQVLIKRGTPVVVNVERVKQKEWAKEVPLGFSLYPQRQ